MSEGRVEPLGLVVREILDHDVDWQGVVRRYPLPSVLVAGVAGFVLGRQHGPTILGVASSMAASYFGGSLEEVVEHMVDDWTGEAEPEDDGVYGAEEGAAES